MNILWEQSLQRFASECPEQKAIISADKAFSYFELKKMSEQASSIMDRFEVTQGNTLALYLPNNIYFVASFFGAVRIAAVALTLNTKYTDEELEQYLTYYPLAGLVTDSSNYERIDKIIEKIGARFPIINIEDELAKAPQEQCHTVDTSAASPALMQFSTGSTGLPKAVVRTHENLITEIEGATLRNKISKEDRVAALIPLFHAHGFGNAMCAALFNGATLVMAETFAPRSALQLLAQENVTVFPSVPFMLKMILLTKLKEEADLSALRLCISAGAALDSQIAEQFHKRFACPISQLYGSTETGALTLDYMPKTDPPIVTVGTPLEHVDINIYSEEGLPLLNGEIGEIGIRTKAAINGYLNNQKATSDAFRAQRFFPGDLGKIDNRGRLYITGRKSFFINSGGNKVDPAEVEEIILEIDGVKEVVCIGVGTNYGGELVKAVIVTEDSTSITSDAIKRHCTLKLASFKVPKQIEFRDELPRSPLGKILRKFLV